MGLWYLMAGLVELARGSIIQGLLVIIWEGFELLPVGEDQVMTSGTASRLHCFLTQGPMNDSSTGVSHSMQMNMHKAPLLTWQLIL